MKVKDKIDVFTRMVMNEAEEKRYQILAEVSEQLQQACDSAEKKASKNAEEMIKQAEYKAEQMKNKEIIEANTKSKKLLIQLRNELTQKIEKNIIEKLYLFMDSPEYETYLISAIQNGIKLYGDADVVLMEKDIHYAEKIKLMQSCDVFSVKEDFIGGFKLMLKNKKAVVDNSFASKLLEEMNHFNEFKIIG